MTTYLLEKILIYCTTELTKDKVSREKKQVTQLTDLRSQCDIKRIEVKKR